MGLTVGRTENTDGLEGLFERFAGYETAPRGMHRITPKDDENLDKCLNYKLCGATVSHMIEAHQKLTEVNLRTATFFLHAKCLPIDGCPDKAIPGVT